MKENENGATNEAGGNRGVVEVGVRIVRRWGAIEN